MAMGKSRPKIKTNTSTNPSPSPSPSPSRSSSIFTYEAPWQIYAASWSSRSDHPFRIAAASFIEHEPSNRIQILSLNSSSFTQNPSLSFDHPYPPTKLMFLPTTSTAQPDLLASSGDLLRIWAIQSDDPDSATGSCVYLRSVLKSTSAEFSAPLTSFDWNDTGSCNSIAACSIDTTVSVWDLEREVLETQLIAHDKEVYDVAWGEARVFGSVSADGSLRIFDLRDKEHSTIIYESPQPDTPILRLSWNTRDRRYLAAITMDSGKVIVLDIRSPTVPVTVLDRHSACVNAISWAPNSASHLCSAGDDAQALIWQLPSFVGPAGTVDFGSNPEDQLISGSGVDPVLAYDADGEINQLQWSTLQPDWMAIAFGNKLQVLKV